MAMNLGGNESQQYAFDLNVAIDNQDLCSLCHDMIVNNNIDGRTIVTLKCNHKFHLDCIGSSFNAIGSMQCPTCGNIEPGEWLYANGLFNPEEGDEEFVQEFFEEEAGPIFLDDLLIGSELCPFEDVGHLSSRGHECYFVECSVTIPPAGSPIYVFPPAHIPNPYPLFLNIPLPSNRRIFWSASSQPGVMILRHYIDHPSANHSQSDILMVNAPIVLSDPSSSTIQLNSILSPLGNLSTPVSHGYEFMPDHEQLARGFSDLGLNSFGSNQANSSGLNPSNIWEHEPFLEPAEQQLVERDFYRLIYGGIGEESDNSIGGNDNNGVRDSDGGNSGNNNFGGNGDGDNRGNDNFGGNGDGGNSGNDIIGGNGDGGNIE